MSKKLLSLVLVLAFSSLAAAVQWDGGAGTSNWEDALNWTSDRLPAETDTNCQIYLSTGATSTIYISTAVQGSRKPQMKFGTTNLIINSGGSMSASGSFEQTQGTASTVTVLAGGLLDVAKKVTITTGTYKIGTSGTSVDTLNVYGTVKVKNQGTMTTTNSDIMVGGAVGGTATANIYAGGLLDVDAYSIGVSNDKIKIWNGGVMKIKGDVRTQVAADKAASKIIRGDGGYVSHYYTAGYTYVVPEPATVALLGLGSLMLMRRKR